MLKGLALQALVMVVVLGVIFYVIGLRGSMLGATVVVPTVVTVALNWARARRSP
jgi:hypothetical protein